MGEINFIRYVLLFVVVGVGLSFVARFIRILLAGSAFEIQPFLVSGAVIGGGMVATMIVVNRLICKGRCKWLLRSDQEVER